MRLTRAAVVVGCGLAIGCLAAAVAVVSPEIVMTDAVAIGPSAAPVGDPAVATDGTNFLVVWNDIRGGSAVYATLVAPDGTLLTPTGFAIATAPTKLSNPDVSFDGTSYFVVWANDKSGRIEGARVTAAGVVLDTPPAVISSSTGAGPRIASVPGVSLVAWAAPGSGQSVVNYTRLDGSLRVLDQPDLQLNSGASSAAAPIVTTDGTDFLVSYQSGSSMVAARVSAAGVVVDTPAITLGPTNGQSAAVRLPGAYLVIWVAGSYELYGVRVQSDGTLLDTTPNLLRPSGGGTLHAPSAAYNGSSLLLSWTREIGGRPWDVYARRFSASLLPLDAAEYPLGVGTQGLDDHGRLAANATAFLGVWDTNSPNDYPVGNILGGVLPATLSSTTSTPVMVSRQGNAQDSPALAMSGPNAFVAWSEGPGALSDIRGQLFSASGPVFDGGVVICAASGLQDSPSVASYGSGYLAVWNDVRAGYSNVGVYAATISGSGVVLAPDGFSLVTTPTFRFAPSVAASGTEYLVTWSDGRATGLNIWAARVLNNAAILDPDGFPITNDAENHSNSRAAAAGQLFLVVFEVGGPRRIGFVRVTESGSVLDTTTLISGVSGNQYLPSVASDGTDFLVVWADLKADGGFGISGARVAGDGGVLDPMPISISTSVARQTEPRVAFDGERYLIAWETNTDLVGVLMTRGGQLEGAEAQLTTLKMPAQRFGLVATPITGRTLAAYAAYDSRPGYATGRVHARFINVIDGGFVVDAGQPDAGQPDGGTPVDAGLVDAGSSPSDAGSLSDGGAAGDSGVPAADAAIALDGGGDGGGEAFGDAGLAQHKALVVGCGCQSTGLGSAVVALAVMLASRRRRTS